MVTQDEVRQIALALPGASEHPERFAFSVANNGKEKGFAWVWNERVEPKKPRVPRPDVLAIRVTGEVEKQMLLEAEPEKFFTEPHYNGFPAILVRLVAVDEAELRELLTDGWYCVAPAKLRSRMLKG